VPLINYFLKKQPRQVPVFYPASIPADDTISEKNASRDICYILFFAMQVYLYSNSLASTGIDYAGMYLRSMKY